MNLDSTATSPSDPEAKKSRFGVEIPVGSRFSNLVDKKPLNPASVRCSGADLNGPNELAASAAEEGLSILRGTDCLPEYVADAHKQLGNALHV